jgi:tRNA (guanine37-N1)-methyltransferase
MNSKFCVTILTLFPEMFPGPLGFSLAGKALQSKVWQYNIVDIKKFGRGKHKNVDDTPYGGGNGLVIRPDVLGAALDYAIELAKTDTIYYMSPRGQLLNQQQMQEIVAAQNIIVICGRFAGIDERVLEKYNIIELSLGDFILSGGEIACYALVDSCVRLVDGVLSNKASILEDSFGQLGADDAILEYPLYTKPQSWHNKDVPPVLISGDHKKIKEWRVEKSIEITKNKRPDLLNKNSK